VLASKALDRFDFHKDVIMTNQICLEGLAQHLALVGEAQVRLGLEWNSAGCEFFLQAFLVDGFDEPDAEVIVHLEDGPLNGIALVFE
jgi:hypothetical protein